MKITVQMLKDEFEEIIDCCTVTFGISDGAMPIVFGDDRPEAWRRDLNFNIFRYDGEDIYNDKIISEMRNAINKMKNTTWDIVHVVGYKWKGDEKVTIEVMDKNPFTGNDTVYFGISTPAER